MEKATCVILVDGLRHDYLNKADAPFLYSLGREGLGGIVQETFAFQLRPSFFAGLYPEDCNIAHLYWYEPDASPFRSLRHLPEWPLRVRKIKYFYRALLNSLVRRFEAKVGNTASQDYADIAEIPFGMLKYFAFSEKLNIVDPGALGGKITLFDILRDHYLQWLWIGYPTNDQRTGSILSEFKRSIREEHSLVYLHFAELDWIGHSEGPHSLKQRKVLRNIDSAIKEVFKDLKERFDNVNGLIFGDHGMVEIKRCIDIQKKLKETELREGKDYIYFLDSTQARFWFRREEARKSVEDLLKSVQNGRILTQNDLKNLHFKFNHNHFGELIFIVDDNTMIFPNFFQRKKIAKGMHGYLPHVQGNWAKFIVTGADKTLAKEDPIEMVDIFPLILDLMDLPIPDTCRGINPLA